MLGKVRGHLTHIFKSGMITYVIISALISVIGLAKSTLVLKFFDFAELGIFNINQNFIVSISLMQFGMVTGSYRLFAYKSDRIRGRINSTVLVFFILLSAVLLIGGGIVVMFSGFPMPWYFLVYFILTGVLSLYSNWVNCKLLALGKVKVLNKTNLAATVASLLVIFLHSFIGIAAGLLTFLSQPLIFIVSAYLIVPAIIPQLHFTSFKRFYTKIVAVGFVPYLTSALGYFNAQLGRWLIVYRLGAIALGKTSLVSLYSILVNFFPNAISNFFFPEFINTYESGSYHDFIKVLKRYAAILLIYSVLVCIVTISAATLIVSFFFPRHLESLDLVYCVLPSLVFLCMANPALTVLNAMKRFKEILFGSLISVFSYLLLLGLYFVYFEVELKDFFILESISSLCFFCYNYYVVIKIMRNDFPALVKAGK